MNRLYFRISPLDKKQRGIGKQGRKGAEEKRCRGEKKRSCPFLPRSFAPFLLCLVFLLGSGDVFGWPWSHDLDYHLSYDTQESPMDPPPLSLPRDGKEKIMTREEADKSLGNPIILSEESVKKGEEFFKIYCAACHGPGGKGDGPVAPKFFPPPNLSLPLTQGRTDGYIYGTIAYGGTVMPGYRAALSPEDRWHVVNYVRSLKGK